MAKINTEVWWTVHFSKQELEDILWEAVQKRLKSNKEFQVAERFRVDVEIDSSASNYCTVLIEKTK